MSVEPKVKHGQTSPRLQLVGLIVGDPGPVELWTLARLAETPHDLHVVQAARSSGVSSRKRLRRLIGEIGLAGVCSRLLAARVFGRREVRRQRALFNELFDVARLTEWWATSGIRPAHVPHLNHPEARREIDRLRPDIVVRISGGILKRETFSLARLATLNIHHGQAPAIRGMWSIPWGIIERQRDWIGATVHLIDDGIDTGGVLWRGGPQIAPGDTGDLLFFRTHVEAVAALVRLVGEFASGVRPAALLEQSGKSVYKSAPGLGAWARYLMLRRGQVAPITLQEALRC